MRNEIKVIGIMPIKGMDVIKRIYSGGQRSYTKYNARRVKRTKSNIKEGK